MACGLGGVVGREVGEIVEGGGEYTFEAESRGDCTGGEHSNKQQPQDTLWVGMVFSFFLLAADGLAFWDRREAQVMQEGCRMACDTRRHVNIRGKVVGRVVVGQVAEPKTVGGGHGASVMNATHWDPACSLPQCRFSIWAGEMVMEWTRGRWAGGQRAETYLSVYPS